MAKQLTPDEESTLKRQSRRRLIGAAALTLIVVVTLPLVFDGEPANQSGNEVELRIPDKDNAGEFKPQAGLAEVSAVAAVSAPVAETLATLETGQAGLPAPVAGKPAQATEKPAASPAPAHHAEAKKAEAKPVAKPELKKQESKKAESKPVAKSAATPQTGFVVQVGAFANAASAKALQEKLSKQGFHAYTEKTGDKVRVRVGAYPSREAAEKARHKLESLGLGLHPNVINLG